MPDHSDYVRVLADAEAKTGAAGWPAVGVVWVGAYPGSEQPGAAATAAAAARQETPLLPEYSEHPPDPARRGAVA